MREVYKKQSGGRGKFADIIVNIGPVDEDFTQGGLQFVDEVKGGNIPKEFIPSVQKMCIRDRIIVGSKEEYDRILANKKTVLDYNEVE